MPTKGEKAEFKCSDARIKIGDKFVPLGKIESVEAITDDTEVPAETIGLDMTGFAFGNSETLTMELKIENPLKLKLMLMGIPVVNVIMCKNCKHLDTTKFCRKHRNYFSDDFYCGYGELKCQE